MALIKSALSVASCLLLSSGSAWAQSAGTKTAEPPKPNVVFNHQTNAVQIFDLDLEDGEQFLVRIANTCPSAFDYPYTALKRGSAGEAQSLTKKPLDSHDITVVYDAAYGGYVFNIVQKPDKDPSAECEGGETLAPGSFVVSVREKKWGLSFSGGFTFSGLTSPVYGIRTEGGTKRLVDETDDKGDGRKLGVASFVHVFHDKAKWRWIQPALAFGLGINGDNRSEYFVGAGLRLGDLATINVGRAFGSITRLPNGVDLNAPVTDDNILSNLGTQVVSRYFFAVTFSFVDTRDNLKKPFASDSGGSQAAAGKEAQEEETPETESTAVALVKNIASNPQLYAGIPAMEGVTLCRAEVTSEDQKAMTVTLHVKEGAQLEKLQAQAVVSAVTDALKKAGVMLKQPVAFGSTCGQ